MLQIIARVIARVRCIRRSTESRLQPGESAVFQSTVFVQKIGMAAVLPPFFRSICSSSSSFQGVICQIRPARHYSRYTASSKVLLMPCNV